MRLLKSFSEASPTSCCGSPRLRSSSSTRRAKGFSDFEAKVTRPRDPSIGGPGEPEIASGAACRLGSIRLLRRTMTISTAGERSSEAAFVAEVEELVRHWVDAAAALREDRSAQRLAALLKDPDGLDFTVAFVDRVVRPEDARVAAASLRELAARPPRFLPWHLRLGLRVAGVISRGRESRHVRRTRCAEVDGGPSPN